VAIVCVTFVLTRSLRNRLCSNCTLKKFKAIDCTFPETLPGKLKARPVQQPATPALIPGNKIIDMLMHSCIVSILLIQRNKKRNKQNTDKYKPSSFPRSFLKEQATKL